MNFILTFFFLTKIVSCEVQRHYVSFTDWNQMNESNYKNYEIGFPKYMTWSKLCGIYSPTPKKWNMEIKPSLQKYIEELNTGVNRSIIEELKRRLKVSSYVGKVSAADFLCIFGENELFFCEWQHFRLLYSWVSYLFQNPDHVSALYIFAACSMHKFKDDKTAHNDDIRFNTALCPNPCKNDDFNPCAYVRNTMSDICIVLNEEFMIYEDNFECQCKYQYKWDPNSHDCKLQNLCENNSYCGGFEKSYRCDMFRRSSDFQALGFNDYEVVCNCTSQYMGLRCEKIRDPCYQNNKGIPGHIACGSHGTCISINETNEYKCDCDEGYADDPQEPLKDCFEMADPCKNLVCVKNNGYCITSIDKKSGECICYEGFQGNHCEKIVGLWLQWKPWSSCNPLCSKERKRSRSRQCSDPKDMAKCYVIGNEFNVSEMFCNPRPCITDSIFSKWSIWSSCKNGFSERKRNCDYMKNSDTDETMKLDCLGVLIEKRKCYFPFYFEVLAPILVTIILTIIIFSSTAIYLHQLIKIYKNRIKKLNTKNKKNAIKEH